MLEAARIDGASEGQISRQIVLPILTPIIVTLALYVFLSSWNDFMWPLRSEEHTSELQSLMRSSYAVFCLINKKTSLTTLQIVSLISCIHLLTCQIHTHRDTQ